MPGEGSSDMDASDSSLNFWRAYQPALALVLIVAVCGVIVVLVASSPKFGILRFRRGWDCASAAAPDTTTCFRLRSSYSQRRTKPGGK